MDKFNYKKIGSVLFLIANIIYLSTAPFVGIETNGVYLVKSIATCIGLIASITFVSGWIIERRKSNRKLIVKN